MFVQIFIVDGIIMATCPETFPQCQDIDQASSALIQDLATRVEDTLVVWGGELGA